MKVAGHHRQKPGQFWPRRPWTEDTFVQWGGHGIVLSDTPYRTAFFEVFPSKAENAGGFIRGEGSTIEEAEDNAFAKFEREITCNHLWGRERYRNGGQLCRHCRAFRCGHLMPVVELGHMRKALSRSEAVLLDMKEDDHKPDAETPYMKQLRLRRNLFGRDGSKSFGPGDRILAVLGL